MKKNVFAIASIALLCFGALTLLSSCLKTNNKMPTLTGVVSVLHADPNAPTMNVVFNGSNLGTLSYGQPGVTQPTVGNYTISFVNPVSNDTLNQIADSIGANYYTLVLYDTTSPAKVMFFQDQIDQPTSQQNVYVRFFQLSADAGPVDVVMDSTQIYTGRTFADNVSNPQLSKFSQYSQGYHSFAVLSSSTHDTLGKLVGIPLLAGNAYTVFLQGVANGASDSLGLKLKYMPNFRIFSTGTTF